MKRILFYLVLVVFVGIQLGAQAQQKAAKMNVIMLMADDLGWGDVGFNGNDVVMTPQLDKMSESGVKFNNFYAAAPLCSPTRASCLTGRSPFRQAIFAAHTGGMRSAETTIAEVLKKEGYATGFFGKWHLGWVEPDKVETRGIYSPPWHHGFDDVFCTKSAVPTYNPTKNPEGWKGFGSGKNPPIAGETWGGSIYVQNGVPVTENLDGDDSRVIMDRALPFIEKSLKEDKPFLATIWFHTPHEPVVAGPEYLAKYPDLELGQQHLYGCITAMDDQIARLQEFLKENELDENTVIFFCSDNGPADGLTVKGIASAGPFRGHKHTMYEGGLRVPSFIIMPGQKVKKHVSNVLANTNDYFPTILDMLGITIKPKKQVPLDGISLLPILNGDAIERTEPFTSGFQRLYQDKELYALIHNEYKICIPEKGAGWMLFNLETDPGETTNLAAEKPEVLKELQAELEKIKEDWKLSREGRDYKW